MNKIMVETVALEAAAGVIATAAGEAQEGRNVIARAAGAGSGAFGGEPIGAAFSAMAERALTAASAIVDTTNQLASNTGAAVYGYIVTDKGAIPSSRRIIHGAELPRVP